MIFFDGKVYKTLGQVWTKTVGCSSRVGYFFNKFVGFCGNPEVFSTNLYNSEEKVPPQSALQPKISWWLCVVFVISYHRSWSCHHRPYLLLWSYLRPLLLSTSRPNLSSHDATLSTISTHCCPYQRPCELKVDGQERDSGSSENTKGFL